MFNREDRGESRVIIRPIKDAFLVDVLMHCSFQSFNTLMFLFYRWFEMYTVSCFSSIGFDQSHLSLLHIAALRGNIGFISHAANQDLVHTSSKFLRFPTFMFIVIFVLEGAVYIGIYKVIRLTTDRKFKLSIFTNWTRCKLLHSLTKKSVFSFFNIFLNWR